MRKVANQVSYVQGLRKKSVARNGALGAASSEMAKTRSKLSQIDHPEIPDGLRYVSDHEPGLTRRRLGKKGFAYLDQNREKIKNERTVERIKALVIPPAWEDVWICRLINGHLQVTGRDARDRKQYRYHEKWTTVRNETKFQKLSLFGEKLPLIQAQTEHDLKLPGLPKNKVLAAVVQIMDLTRIRVGNEIYAQENDSYGLTTIRNEHATIKGSKVRFKFRGKSGVQRDVSFSDPRLSRIVKKCQDLPGEELFCFEDEHGEVHDISSTDVNDYLRNMTGDSLTAKDFRTWGGTVKAVELLTELEPLTKATAAARKKRELEVIKGVAAHLGNTVSVCRKYYVHPAVLSADGDGFLAKAHAKHSKKKSANLSTLITLEILKRSKTAG